MVDMLEQIKKMGFNSCEDFIKAYFHLLTDNEKRLAELVGLHPSNSPKK